MSRKNLKDLEHIHKNNEDYLESVKRLIEVVQSTPKENINTLELDNEILQYITDRQLKSGSVYIPGFLIYLDYLKWCEFKPRHTSISFFKTFHKKFPKKRVRYGVVYAFTKDNFIPYQKLTLKQVASLKEQTKDDIARGELYATEGKTKDQQTYDSED